MSNQRPGKSKPASMREEGMTVLRFFRNAKEALEASGKEDEAFYFEQMEDWILQGNSLPQDVRECYRALGL